MTPPPDDAAAGAKPRARQQRPASLSSAVVLAPSAETIHVARARKKQTDAQAAAIDQALGGSQPSGQTSLRRWRHFSPDEHIAWVESTCYRKTKGLGWAPLRYASWQREVIRKLFAVDDDGELHYSTVMPCFPRRTDKTGILTRYDLCRAIAFPDQKIAIQGNSSDQGAEAILTQIVETIQNSPMFRRVGTSQDPEIYRIDAPEFGQTAGEVTIYVYATAITTDNGSSIIIWPAAGGSTLGRGLSVYHNTEGCLATSDENYQVGASSVGDQWSGVAMVDSNMGDAENYVARFAALAADAEVEAAAAADEGREVDPSVGDPQIGCVLIQFGDLDDCLRRGCGVGLDDGIEPIHPWLDAAWIRSRYATMLRGEFRRNHCNQPAGLGETLWSEPQVDSLFLDGLPAIIGLNRLGDVPSIVAGHDGPLAWSIGVGLDRAGAFSKTPDRSVVTAVGKATVPGWVDRPRPVYDEAGEVVGEEICDGTVYVLLGAWEFMRALRDPIQSCIQDIHRRWGIDGCALEQYQASDLGEWAKQQPFGEQTRVRHMTSQAKAQLVAYAHGLIVTRRFFASAYYSVLHREILNYAEDCTGGGQPTYGAKRKKVTLDFSLGAMVGETAPRNTIQRETWIKDDYWESAMWAIESVRETTPRRPARIFRKPESL